MPKEILNAIIIDDEQDARSFLKTIISKTLVNKIKIIAEAENLDVGMKKILKYQPDIVFLDVDMPGEYGIKIHEYFKKPEFQIVYITAFKEYAIDAIKNSAVDYLLKPINIIELSNCVNRLIENNKTKRLTKNLQDKLHKLSPLYEYGQEIILNTSFGFFLENTNNIVFCQSDGMYTNIYLFSGKHILVSKPLKKLLALLPENDFLKTHQSYIVNVHYIRRFVKTEHAYLEMRNDERIPVATRKISCITEEIEKRLIK